jgi:hypothetical protein
VRAHRRRRRFFEEKMTTRDVLQQNFLFLTPEENALSLSRKCVFSSQTDSRRFKEQKKTKKNRMQPEREGGVLFFRRSPICHAIKTD